MNQCTANTNTLEHTATHCNNCNTTATQLQHAYHMNQCTANTNTLQHTATHCNNCNTTATQLQHAYHMNLCTANTDPLQMYLYDYDGHNYISAFSYISTRTPTRLQQSHLTRIIWISALRIPTPWNTLQHSATTATQLQHNCNIRIIWISALRIPIHYKGIFLIYKYDSRNIHTANHSFLWRIVSDTMEMT